MNISITNKRECLLLSVLIILSFFITGIYLATYKKLIETQRMTQDYKIQDKIAIEKLDSLISKKQNKLWKSNPVNASLWIHSDVWQPKPDGLETSKEFKVFLNDQAISNTEAIVEHYFVNTQGELNWKIIGKVLISKNKTVILETPNKETRWIAVRYHIFALKDIYLKINN